MFPLLLAAALSFPTTDPASAGLSPTRLARVSTLIREYRDRNELAGAVALVARRGRLAFVDAQGYADLEAKTPFRTDTLLRLASMTKPVTTVAALMLLEENRFLLTDPISRFLPEFANPKVAVAQQAAPGGYRLVPATREITILDLLTHRAGLPTSAGPAAALLRASSANPPKTLAEMTTRLASIPLNFQPGSAWEYGAATDVLGRLIEVASGQPLDQFFRDRIFRPLSMEDTSFAVPPSKLSRLAQVYQRESGRLVRVPNPAPNIINGAVFSGGGGLASTPADYLRFCQFLLNGGQLDGQRLLSRKSVELLTEPQWRPIPIEFLRGQYFGLGVAVKEANGDTGLLGSPGAYGWSGAYNTYFRIDPKEQLILLLFVQLFPANDIALQHGFHNAVYQAIAD